MPDIANPDARLSDLLRELPPGDASRLMVGLLKGIAEEAVRDALPASLREFSEQNGYSDAVPTLLEEITSKTGKSGAAVLRKALTLYNAAWNAEEDGNRLAILTPEDEIVHDIVGIHPKPAPAENLVS